MCIEYGLIITAKSKYENILLFYMKYKIIAFSLELNQPNRNKNILSINTLERYLIVSALIFDMIVTGEITK